MKKPTDSSSFTATHAQVQAQRAGELRLQEADRLSCQQAGLQAKVVAFSLFGVEPGYCECAVLNAQAMPSVYAGWQMWVFHDETVPAGVLQRLGAAGARLVDVNASGLSHWPGTFWRFAAVHIAQAGYVLFRDADSIVSPREAELVREWLESGRPFHVVRDWFSHTDLMLAGLWGAWAPLLAGMRAWVDAYLKQTPDLHPTHGDQAFLAHTVWPRVRDFALVHDSVHRLPGVTPFEPPPPHPSGKYALGGYLVKSLGLTFPEQRGRYVLALRDNATQQVICQYEREFRNGGDTVSLPYAYCDAMDEGRWELLVQPMVGSHK